MTKGRRRVIITANRGGEGPEQDSRSYGQGWTKKLFPYCVKRRERHMARTREGKSQKKLLNV